MSLKSNTVYHLIILVTILTNDLFAQDQLTLRSRSFFSADLSYARILRETASRPQGTYSFAANNFISLRNSLNFQVSNRYATGIGTGFDWNKASAFNRSTLYINNLFAINSEALKKNYLLFQAGYSIPVTEKFSKGLYAATGVYKYFKGSRDRFYGFFSISMHQIRNITSLIFNQNTGQTIFVNNDLYLFSV